MSVFLMGVYDASCDKFRTVAKCGNGHDDATILKLQDELDMVKIGKVSRGSILCGICTCVCVRVHVCFLCPDWLHVYWYTPPYSSHVPSIPGHRVAQT